MCLQPPHHFALAGIHVLEIADTVLGDVVADQLTPFVPAGLFALGTDGFGRSEDRAALRRFFEVDAESFTLAALHVLAQRGQMDVTRVAQAITDLGIDPEKPFPPDADL